MFTHILLCLYGFLVLTGYLDAQGIGWRMVDRYYGFRFEIDADFEKDFDERVLSYAEKKACFGWIQRPIENKRVNHLHLFGVTVWLFLTTSCAKCRWAK